VPTAYKLFSLPLISLLLSLCHAARGVVKGRGKRGKYIQNTPLHAAIRPQRTITVLHRSRVKQVYQELIFINIFLRGPL